ncbi:MAG: type II secretion system protein M [Methylophilaceae bacterium]|nr:type II secretion system protein M [Methylophilaceae bacterium]
MWSSIKLNWHNAPNNDRRIYMLLAVVVGLAFIYAFIWLPSNHARLRLAQEVIEKESQLQLMQAQVMQVQALQSAVKLSHSNAQGLQTALESSAKLHGLTSNISKIQLNEEGAVDINLPKVNFDSWISWVNALQTEHQIRALNAHIAALGNTSLVQVDATFSAQ